MRVLNKQVFPNIRQRPVCGVEEAVRTHIIPWSYPLSFDSPERFGDVQMWGAWWEVEEEKPSLFP